ncbi:putative Mor domain-containing protein [Azospirillaceae bacterium]
MSDIESMPLPGVLGELACAGYRRAAIALWTERGGVSISVPRSAPGSLLARIIGDAAAAWLVARHAGCEVDVPSVRKTTLKTKILSADGEGTRALARRLGTSERVVRLTRQRARPDDAQGVLF